MKKIYFIFLLIIFSGCTSYKEKTYNYVDELLNCKWERSDLKWNRLNNDFNIKVTVRYKIKNISDENLWFYDLEQGSIWESSVTKQDYNILVKYHSLYSEYNELLPYSVALPKLIYIAPSKVIRGKITLNFDLREENSNNNERIESIKYNFFIFNKEIIINNLEDEKIFTKAINDNCSEYFVEFKIPHSSN